MVFVHRVVQLAHNNQIDDALVIIVVAGNSITSTSGHPYLVLAGVRLADRPAVHELDSSHSTRGRWVSAADIQSGDTMLLRSGMTATVASVSVAPLTTTMVYNLTVAGTHTYTVGSAGVVTHNKGLCPAGMADDVAKNFNKNKNSVSIETPSGKVRIDLKGDSHFSKSLGKDVKTPHVHEYTKHVGPNGRVNMKQTGVREATKQDIRTARRALERR